MKNVLVNISQMDHAKGLALPEYATEGSAGVDLTAAIEENLCIAPGEFLIVPTGIQIALPQNYEAQIRPRSGLAANKGISVLNAPGTIDADYRGEIKVILINLGTATFEIERGMRIAQMVVAPYTQVSWSIEENFNIDTERGDGGFGSTGT